jgi:hypothetical protein
MPCLPSRDELAVIYTGLKGADTPLGNFKEELYWSSTANNLENAYAIDFGSGEDDPDDAAETKEKHHQYLRVRPVRGLFRLSKTSLR